jgi:tetratricopeptide (TPR) repeat protein
MKKGLNKAWCHYIVEGEKDYQVRLFPNISGIHYIYRCHEQVYKSLLKLGIRLYFFPRQFISIQPPSPISPPRNIRLLEMDISENPDNLMAYNWLAREHFASGEYNKGFTLIDNLLSKRDKWETPEEIYIYRFALGLKNHWLSRAILEGIVLDKALLKTLITACDLAVAHNNCGTVWFNKGMLDEAISEYIQAIDINPIYVEAYINLGVAYREKGMLDESIAQHKKAIDIDPNLVIGYINLGVTYHMKGIFDEAIAQYKHVLRIDPNNADAHFNLGVAYRNKGMINEAISEYEHAVTINPDLAEAHNNLAVAYYSKKQYGLAIKHCDKAIELGFKVHPRFLQDLEQHRK